MNIIFLTISRITDINQRGIYTDLMRKFRDEGHKITIVNPVERKFKLPTKLIEQEGIRLLNVKTLNVQKTNVVEKGLGIILLEYQFIKAINRHLGTEKFDLILYSTPPITLTKIIRKLKEANPRSITYLLLKDIFPNNAVEMGMFSENSLFFKYFRRKEILLYKISDFIGCMSPANVNYILSRNTYLDKQKVEVCPNSIEPVFMQQLQEENDIKRRYNLPIDKKIVIYGGNLGKPQGLNFLLEIIESNIKNEKAHFLIVGSGTEYIRIERWFKDLKPTNASLIEALLKDEFDNLLTIADIGLIFLDPRFTIPNFPSRLLSYLENKIPVIAATDPNTDLGSILVENRIGFWCLNGDLAKFNSALQSLLSNETLQLSMGENGYEYLIKNYTVKDSYQIIMNHFS